jgi:hypothetical protein
LRFSPGGKTAAWGIRTPPAVQALSGNIMRNLLRYMPLVCLLVPSLALCAQSRNPYDLDLENLRSQWSSASKLEKLVLLRHGLGLREK